MRRESENSFRKHEREGKSWHKWFAWYPVHVMDQRGERLKDGYWPEKIIWLETVERNKPYDSYYGDCCFWRYRLKGDFI